MADEQGEVRERRALEAVPELRAIAWDLKEVIRRLDELVDEINDLASRLPNPQHE